MLDEIHWFRLTPDCFANNMLSPRSIKLHYSVQEHLPNTHIEEDPSVKASTQLNTCVTDANRYTDPKHIDFKCPSHPCAI